MHLGLKAAAELAGLRDGAALTELTFWESFDRLNIGTTISSNRLDISGLSVLFRSTTKHHQAECL